MKLVSSFLFIIIINSEKILLDSVLGLVWFVEIKFSGCENFDALAYEGNQNMIALRQQR